MIAPLLLPGLAAENPLDNDAGSGGDAGDVPEDATPIGAGYHRGRITTHLDTDDYYAFEAEKDQGLHLLPGRGFPITLPYRVEVISPEGDAWSASYGAEFIVPTTGTWLVHVYAYPFYEFPTEYSFLLELVDLPPQDDAGSGGDAGFDRAHAVPLPDGQNTGYLGEFDEWDYFSFNVTANEPITLTLQPPAGNDFDLALVNSDGYWIGYSAASGDSTDSIGWTASSDETVYAVVYRWAGGGNYTLTLERGGGGTPESLHHLTPVVDGLPYPGDLVAAGNEVDVTSYGGIWRVNATDATLTRKDTDSWLAAARDGKGRLYVDDWNTHNTVRLDESGTTPALRGEGPLAFGPDGFLYTVQDSVLYRVSEDRLMEPVARLGGWWARVFDLAFTPDGDLYYTRWTRGDVNRVDLDTGEVTTVFTLGGTAEGLAFDMNGLGYVADGERGFVYQFDPATGNRTMWSADVSGPVHLAFAGSRLFVSNMGYGPATNLSNGVGYYEAGVQGFPGFTPTFELAPLPDLVVTSIEEKRNPVRTDFFEVPNVLNEKRTLLVEITNVGEGTAHGDFRVDLIRNCGKSNLPFWYGVPFTCWRTETEDFTRVHETLAPGESLIVELEWDTTMNTGDQELTVVIDRYQESLEQDHGNNAATHDSFVRVGGLGGFS